MNFPSADSLVRSWNRRRESEGRTPRVKCPECGRLALVRRYSTGSALFIHKGREMGAFFDVTDSHYIAKEG